MSKTSESIALLEEIRELMNMKGENPFKVRAFEKAAKTLVGHDDLVERAQAGTLTELPGIGKGISEVLTEFLQHGKSTALEELKKDMPAGLPEIASVPGVGPKKAMAIIEELGITTIGELEYACRENRLVHLKGFGEKLQAKILDAIQFMKQNEGLLRIDEALLKAEQVSKAVREKFKLSEKDIQPVGGLRREREVIDEWSFVVNGVKDADLQKHAKALEGNLDFKKGSLKLIPSDTKNFAWQLIETTGPNTWVEEIKSRAKGTSGKTEIEIFEKAGLSYVPPECREEENWNAVFGKKKFNADELVTYESVQGIFHMHTDRSDGANTLEEMVREAKRLGFKYIGLSDHSQSAFYAQGLKPDTLKAQAEERAKIQEKFPEVRVFWGIESDILQDGSLDYDEKILKKFDFVIASVHSRFQMDKKAMTDRIITAIRNPYTRFVGHLTGRLLLGRKPYELDIDQVIEEAAKCNVSIELNAHPARLDIDWRHGEKLRLEKTWVSINPDAHEIAGLSDTRYGVMMARKALLPKTQIINCMSTKEVEAWLQRK